MTPVPELYEMTEAPESDVLEILLLNVLKSVEERYPFVPVVDWVMARVLPEKVRGALMVAEVSCPVPFPVRMPPRVVLPVPPPAAPRIPARVLAKVMVLPEAVMVVEAVRPLKAVEEVAKVTVGPD